MTLSIYTKVYLAQTAIQSKNPFQRKIPLPGNAKNVSTPHIVLLGASRNVSGLSQRVKRLKQALRVATKSWTHYDDDLLLVIDGHLILAKEGLTAKQAVWFSLAAVTMAQKRSWDKETEWLKEVENDCEKAAILGRECLGHAKLNHWKMAFYVATIAVKIEKAYRKPKIWNSFLNIVESLL